MDSAEIYCDGSCLRNPGPGGYGCIVRYNGIEEKEFSGGEPDTTNNRMELFGAIVGLESLKSPCQVTVITDSQYLARGMAEWVDGWRNNGWVTSAGKSVLNRDLWERLIVLSAPHDIKWVWVKGHGGHPLNARCDALARTASGGYVKTPGPATASTIDIKDLSIDVLVGKAIWPYHHFKDEVMRRFREMEAENKTLKDNYNGAL